MSASASRIIVPPACPACGDALPPGAQFCPGCGRAIRPLKSFNNAETELGPRTDVPLNTANTQDTRAELEELVNFLPQRYEPVKMLGQGGMGTVYQCIDKALERPVAIKIMTERYRSDPHGEKRFMREARAQATVNHPNVATVLNFGVSVEGRLFLVMEYLEGQDLRSVIRQEKRIEPIRACELLIQACEGLDEAHNSGLVHRDMKPSNLMIVKDHRGQPRVKILDLGLAKIVGGQTDLKSISMDTAGLLIGTPAYMSPEQVAGNAVDGRADIYSLGVVFYEMVSGRLPFESESMEGWLYQHLHTKPQPPSRFNPDLLRYPQLEQIVMWMLAKNPHERPKTAGELAQLLKRFVAGLLNGEDPTRSARKSGPRPALAFEDNPPARKSGPRVSISYMSPPPPDNPEPNAPAQPSPTEQAAAEQERREQFLLHSRAAEKAEAERKWQHAMDCWHKALPFSERSDNVGARVETCRREIDFEEQLTQAGTAATGGDWQKAEEILNRLNAIRPSDLRVEQARARLPKRLVNAWLDLAKSRIHALPEGDLRQALMERLSTGYAIAGDLQTSLAILQEASKKVDTRVVGLSQAIIAAVQNGHHEGMRPFLNGLAAAANGLTDPAERGRACVEVARALAAYGDQTASAAAFQGALTAFSEANTKGIPMHATSRKIGAALKRGPGDGQSILVTGTLSMPKSVKATWEAAVGVVAHAQSEAGLVDDSLASAALIDDPWTLAQTMSQVAQGFAKTGRSVEAERVTGQITFALPKMQALKALAVTRVYRGDLSGAEEILKNVTSPSERITIHSLLAAGWAMRNETGRAEARLAEAVKSVSDLVGARARFQALVSAAEPLLNVGHHDLAEPLLNEASRLIDLIDDPAERLRSLLQLAQLRENVRGNRLATTRTVAFSHQPAVDITDVLRRALVIWRQIRQSADRCECIERLAASVGSAALPVLATELLAACRDEAERALIYIGLSAGMA